MRKYVSASGKPTFDATGEFQGYRGSARRITEQMRHQELLRESEERFRDFADTASDWFWETGPDHRLSFVSETASMLSGGVRSKAIGKERRELAADVEVIDYASAKKPDTPSGTARELAEMLGATGDSGSQTARDILTEAQEKKHNGAPPKQKPSQKQLL